MCVSNKLHSLYRPVPYLILLTILIACGGNSGEEEMAKNFLESLGATDALGRHVEAVKYACDANEENLITELAVAIPDPGTISSVRCRDGDSSVTCTFTAPVFCVDNPNDPDPNKLLCSIKPEGHDLEVSFEMSESQVCHVQKIGQR
jgi:hypothetical protein